MPPPRPNNARCPSGNQSRGDGGNRRAWSGRYGRNVVGILLYTPQPQDISAAQTPRSGVSTCGAASSCGATARVGATAAFALGPCPDPCRAPCPGPCLGPIRVPCPDPSRVPCPDPCRAPCPGPCLGPIRVPCRGSNPGPFRVPCRGPCPDPCRALSPGPCLDPCRDPFPDPFRALSPGPCRVPFPDPCQGPGRACPEGGGQHPVASLPEAVSSPDSGAAPADEAAGLASDPCAGAVQACRPSASDPGGGPGTPCGRPEPRRGRCWLRARRSRRRFAPCRTSWSFCLATRCRSRRAWISVRPCSRIAFSWSFCACVSASGPAA